MTGSRIVASVIALLSIALIAIIVALSIGANRLGDLIGGVGVIGAIAVVLAVIGVALYARMSASRATREELLYHHAEAMAKSGLMVSDRRALAYSPIPQLETPADVPVSLHGITAEQLAEFKIHAVNLLALSKQEMGGMSGQVLPFYRAKENDYFRDVAIWTNAVRYLIANQIAHEQYKEGQNGRRKIGTFLNAGTVGQAFDALNRP